MKLSVAVLVAAASATEKKVPPRHPLQRLKRLVEFTEELLNHHYSFLPSKNRWIAKFANNATRMKRNFMRGNQRCGYYHENQLPHGGPRERRDVDEIRYNTADPWTGTKQLTTGFRKWAERYISECSGQKNFQHQVNRMNKWNAALQGHLQQHYNKNWIPAFLDPLYYHSIFLNKENLKLFNYSHGHPSSTFTCYSKFWTVNSGKDHIFKKCSQKISLFLIKNLLFLEINILLEIGLCF